LKTVAALKIESLLKCIIDQLEISSSFAFTVVRSGTGASASSDRISAQEIYEEQNRIRQNYVYDTGWKIKILED
jgi:hypothetical protein